MPVWETQLDDLGVALPAEVPIPLPLGSCRTFPILFLLLSLPPAPQIPSYCPRANLTISDGRSTRYQNKGILI